MKKPRIIIEVSGGCVRSIHSDTPIDIDVLDHDDFRVEDDAEDRLHREFLEADIATLHHHSLP